MLYAIYYEPLSTLAMCSYRLFMLYAIYYEHYRIRWRCVLTDVDGHGAGGDALAEGLEGVAHAAQDGVQVAHAEVVQQVRGRLLDVFPHLLLLLRHRHGLRRLGPGLGAGGPGLA